MGFERDDPKAYFSGLHGRDDGILRVGVEKWIGKSRRGRMVAVNGQNENTDFIVFIKLVQLFERRCIFRRVFSLTTFHGVGLIRFGISEEA